MTNRTLRPALGLVLLTCIALSACEDPSNVGLGLVGDEGGDPEVLTYETTFLESAEQGGIVSESASAATRALVGAVDDPLTGRIESRGFLDFSAISLSNIFQGGTVSAVTLNLVPDYVYGDTTASVTLSVYDVDEEFTSTVDEESELPPAGALVTEFTFLPSDTLIAVELPEAWVSANDATLRSDNFATDFHGLMLEYVSGNAVVGFRTQTTNLSPVVGSDTVALPFSKNISVMSRGEIPVPAEDRILIQNGPGPSVSFAFDFADSLDVALNRAVFRFYVDTLITEPEGAFVRPTASNLSLVGIRSDTLAAVLTITTMNEGGWFDFDAALLRTSLEASFNGTFDPYERYELRAQPISGVTISPLFLYGRSDPEKSPKAILTFTPLQ